MKTVKSTMQCKFTSVTVLWIKIELILSSIQLILKFNQYQNANIVNFVVILENSNVDFSSKLNRQIRLVPVKRNWIKTIRFWFTTVQFLILCKQGVTWKWAKVVFIPLNYAMKIQSCDGMERFTSIQIVTNNFALQ